MGKCLISHCFPKENDNLRHEYSALFNQVQRDIPFARIALEKAPDAINMWYVRAMWQF